MLYFTFKSLLAKLLSTTKKSYRRQQHFLPTISCSYPEISCRISTIHDKIGRFFSPSCILFGIYSLSIHCLQMRNILI